MTRLLVDAGNSRIKWAAADGVIRTLAYGGDADASVGALLGAAGDVQSAAIVDVTGAIAEALASRIDEVRVLRAGAEACGVRSGYTDPTLLGADRWAALIGAFVHGAGACCIVDAGTALTCDLLTADGRHLGGWIAPGPALARAALARGTRGVRPIEPGRQGAEPALNTADAVAGGVALAALGFVERAYGIGTRVLGVEPALLVTGGDAALVAAAFPGAQRIDDLVLRGLAAWADA